jgi:hypothetical protein
MKIYVLGMRREGRKDTPIMKLFLALWTFADITTVTTFINTLVTCFLQEEKVSHDNKTPIWPEAWSAFTRAEILRGQKVTPEVASHRSSPRMKQPSSVHMSSPVWSDTKIIVNTERL